MTRIEWNDRNLMRFLSDGPNIPDLLLEQRDEGRVVFLCGAGVSLDSGMPDFRELTEYVVNRLDPEDDSPVTRAFRPWKVDTDDPKVPLDRIFSLLDREYDSREVRDFVAERLSIENQEEVKCQNHKLIARISSDATGSPQIVTTNFDLLFEHAVGNQVPSYDPPTFPDIDLGSPITGITHLHGRLSNPGVEQHRFVLGSSDFGRAYLSEGWATNFVRSLLERYTVVLIGYRAEDPPMDYLLQGLNHDEKSDRTGLYAFDMGHPDEVDAEWRSKGVTAIAYNDHPRHLHLWKSLEAWARRADDPERWKRNLIEMSVKKGPRRLTAHERGQVAHLVRTSSGARLFADADPAPPAEWLCVFDATCRAAERSSRYGRDAETFDPLEVYGLDDDPPRPSEIDHLARGTHDNLLKWRQGDTNPSTSHRLIGRRVGDLEDMPNRLFHLSKWIVNGVNSPVTVWWALRQWGLHPRLMAMIRLRLDQPTDLPPEARRIWNLVLEYHSNQRNFVIEGAEGIDCLELSKRIGREGWNPSVLRAFETVTAPVLSYRRPPGLGMSKPPSGNWAESVSELMGGWHVRFSRWHDGMPEVPDEVLDPVFDIVQRHFRRTAGLLDDLKAGHFPTPSCYPETETDDRGRGNNVGPIFHLFRSLLVRLAEYKPTIARARAIAWPANERFIFGKLKLFALNRVELFKADEVAGIVLKLDNDIFWNWYVRRELLLLLRNRWDEFCEADRNALTDRLLNGPERMEHWSKDEYPRIRDGWACKYVGWLLLEGRSMSPDCQERLDEMISGLPDWSDDQARNVIREQGVRVYSIRSDETPDAIADLPVDKIAREAKPYRDGPLERRPFTGLVKADPGKALDSLSHEAGRGIYPAELWAALIGDWPEAISSQLFRDFLTCLTHLPNETIHETRYVVGLWFENRFPSALEFDPALAWRVFDHLTCGLLAGDGTTAEKVAGDSWMGVKVVEPFQRTYEEAINDPIGRATKALLGVLNSLKLDQGQGMPRKYRDRINLLLVDSREGSKHAVAILAYYINWLHQIDRNWVMDRMIPWFAFDHPMSEPAWNGFLHCGRLLPPEVRVALKPMMLGLFPRIHQWNWDERPSRHAADIVVCLAVFGNSEPGGLSFREARQCLRNMDEACRYRALFTLRDIGQQEDDGWAVHVIPFIKEAWPRERKFRSASLNRSLLIMLANSGKSFPAVLDAVYGLLIPHGGHDFDLYRFGKERGNEPPLATIHPAAVLKLLDAVIPGKPEHVPYKLEHVLELIRENGPGLARDPRFLRLKVIVAQG